VPLQVNVLIQNLYELLLRLNDIDVVLTTTIGNAPGLMMQLRDYTKNPTEATFSLDHTVFATSASRSAGAFARGLRGQEAQLAILTGRCSVITTMCTQQAVLAMAIYKVTPTPPLASPPARAQRGHARPLPTSHHPVPCCD
jgi:hypothetical protein